MTSERYWIDFCIDIARSCGNEDAACDATKELERLQGRVNEYEICTDAGRERRLRFAAEARLAEAKAAAKTWENEAERRSRRYEKAAVRLAEVEAERDALLFAVQRWKIEELRQLHCQCAKPREFDLNGIPWCDACDKPRRWENVKLRDDERDLLGRAADCKSGTRPNAEARLSDGRGHTDSGLELADNSRNRARGAP